MGLQPYEFTPEKMADALARTIEQGLFDRTPAAVIGKLVIDKTDAYETYYEVPAEDVAEAYELLGDLCLSQ